MTFNVNKYKANFLIHSFDMNYIHFFANMFSKFLYIFLLVQTFFFCYNNTKQTTFNSISFTLKQFTLFAFMNLSLYSFVI